LLVLRNGLPPSAMGTTGFVPAAAMLLGIALLLGLVIGLRRRRRPPGALVAVHASVAIAGFVVLWAVVSLD
jgi:LPXTG-motif cell wall-anchored protein